MVNDTVVEQAAVSFMGTRTTHSWIWSGSEQGYSTDQEVGSRPDVGADDGGGNGVYTPGYAYPLTRIVVRKDLHQSVVSV